MFVIHGGNEDDGNVRGERHFLQRHAGFDTRHLGHHVIQQNEIRALRSRNFECFRPGGSNHHVIGGLQNACHDPYDGDLVVDNEDQGFFSLFHCTFPSYCVLVNNAPALCVEVCVDLAANDSLIRSSITQVHQPLLFFRYHMTQSPFSRSAPLRLLALLVLLAGCSDGGSPYEGYAAKLARVLDEDVAAAGTTMSPLTFPRVRDNRISFTEKGIDLLDFLSLGGCELQGLVALRNSGMGRMAPASQQLVYELQFLSLAERCLETLDAALAAEFEVVLLQKKAELPARIFLATLAGPEFREYWSTTGSSDGSDAGRIAAAISAMKQDMQGWLAGNYEVSSGRLEGQLEVIRSGTGGADVAAWSALATGLPTATTILMSRQARRPLCFEGMKTDAADILRNVVMTEFIGGIQQDIAKAQKTTIEVLPLVTEMEQMLYAAETRAYRDWRTRRDADLGVGAQALAEHVEALQPLMQQCGFIPATDPT